MNLLIVDDNPAHIKAIRCAFEEAGSAMEISEAGTLSEYRELIEKNPPDIALLDLNLPDGKAVQVLNTPPENNPFPILIMTGQGDQKAAVEAIKAGALDYIVKSSETILSMPHYVEQAMREWELLRNRKRSTEALRANQSFMKTILDTMQAGVIIIDLKTHEIVDANLYALKLLGASREQVIGTICHKYICPAETGKCPVCDLGQKVDNSERVLIKHDGSQLPILKTVVPVTINGEDCLLEHFIDISERKHAEMGLRESENRYRSLYLYSKDAIMTVLLEEGFLSGNPATISMFGCKDEQDFITRSPTDLSPERQPDGRLSLVKCQEMMRLALTNGSNFFEWTYKRLDGTEFPATVLLSKLDYSGNDHLLLATVRDISEQKQAEEKARQAQKMEVVGRMASGVAHDFNNLLTPIMVNCSFLLESTPEEDPRRADIIEIRDAADRAAVIVKQLLSFSRKQILRPTILDVDKLISEMERLLCTMAGKSIQVKISAARNPAWVKADPGQLEQVIVNLVVNARDAMPEGGAISLETANIVITKEARVDKQPEDILPGEYVVLAVADNGSGMDEKVIAHIFEPFFTTKAPGKGTGLGLATVYDIVKKGAGFISVESIPGTGTTFKIFLPALSAPGKSLEDKAVGDIKAEKSPYTVLVVEDEDDMRQITSRILQTAGYNVIEAATAGEALQFSAVDYDVLFVDMFLPDTLGTELVRKLAGGGMRKKVIFTSAFAEKPEIRKMLSNPENRFLQKPFTREALLEMVKQTLR